VSTDLDADAGTLVLNDDYDGTDDNDELLDTAESTLAVDASDTILLTVTVTPANSEADYTNVASATADSPTGDEVEDDDDTEHTFSARPVIAVATCLPESGIVPNAELPGQYQLTFSVMVRNFGNVQLDDVSTELDLSEVFQYSDWLEFIGVDGDFASGSYDGETDTELFEDGTTLYSASQVTADDTLTDRAEFEVTVDIIPGSNL